MNDSAKLGNNLKRIREAKKMSQGDVMRKMGCSRSYISNIENGKTNPTLETISRLAKVLDVSTTELLK
jgi:transcriptional regulator with XRE-family HTH domain